MPDGRLKFTERDKVKTLKIYMSYSIVSTKFVVSLQKESYKHNLQMFLQLKTMDQMSFMSLTPKHHVRRGEFFVT